jgi:hypothetical protein
MGPDKEGVMCQKIDRIGLDGPATYNQKNLLSIDDIVPKTWTIIPIELTSPTSF